MGQNITENNRTVLKEHKDVLEVTRQHIILKDGRIVDPADFELAPRRVRLIYKLLQCPCSWFRHEVGLHVIVEGTVHYCADGSQKNTFPKPKLCRSGQWTLEEVVY